MFSGFSALVLTEFPLVMQMRDEAWRCWSGGDGRIIPMDKKTAQTLWTGRWVALDFETAQRSRESACAVGLVRVERGEIVRRAYRLIRPPSSRFEYSSIHGLSWADVSGESPFHLVWQDLRDVWEGAELFVAHNVGFDRSVLEAGLARYGAKARPATWFCTVKRAKAAWSLPSGRLSAVCQHLGLPLQHHHALSDAEAAARIALALAALAWTPVQVA